jgi:class 3 adenylate cyclase
LTETGYVGIAVHTAARVCAAARGGQILLTSTARAALDGLDGVVLRSRGKVALKGFPERETLYTVMATATLAPRA